MARRSFFANFSLNFAGNLGQRVMGFAFRVVALLLVSPADFGTLLGVLVALDYLNNLQLGTPAGLSKLAPLMRGAGEAEAERRLAGTVFSLTFLAGLVPALAVLLAWGAAPAFAAWVLGSGSTLAIAGAAAIFFFGPHFQYLLAFHAGRSDFAAVARMRLVFSALNLGLALALGRLAGLPGILAGYAIAQAAGAAAGWPRGGWRWTFDWPLLRRALAFGLPLAGFNLVQRSLLNLDKIMIAAFLTRRDLGYYGLGLTVVEGLLLLAGGLGTVLYPYLAEEYAARRDGRTLRRGWEAGLRLAAAAAPLPLAAAAALGPVLVRLYRPEYAGGLGALTILCVAGFFAVLLPLANQIYVVRERQGRLMLIGVLALLLGAALNLGAIRLGAGIEGVAGATTLTFAAFILCLLSAVPGPGPAAGGLTGTLRFFGAAGLAAAAGTGGYLCLAGSGMIMPAAVFLGVFLPVYLLLAAPGGLRRDWRTLAGLGRGGPGAAAADR